MSAFNPTKFNPDVWASSAKGAGMKYFVMCVHVHTVAAISLLVVMHRRNQFCSLTAK